LPAAKPRLECLITLLSTQQQQQQQYQSVTLLVENRRGEGGRGGWAEVSLHLGGNPGHVVWTDRVPEQVCAG
jgi:hypothetical protein